MYCISTVIYQIVSSLTIYTFGLLLLSVFLGTVENAMMPQIHDLLQMHNNCLNTVGNIQLTGPFKHNTFGSGEQRHGAVVMYCCIRFHGE